MSDTLWPKESSGQVLVSLSFEIDQIYPNKLDAINDIIIKKATELRSGPKIYPMKAKVRGYCVIIDNTEFDDINAPTRDGSRTDADRLKQIYTQLGFTVICEQDLTAEKMRKLCRVVSQSPELSKHDALTVIILSHGDDNGVICGRDFEEIKGKMYGYVTDKELLHEFNDENCPLLKGKPKMFFLNCCRGGKEDKIQIDLLNEELLSDMFVGYGTRKGCVGFRDPSKGSFFTVALAEKLIELSADTEWKTIFDEVTDRVLNMTTKNENGEKFAKQRPIYIPYEWNKDLYFNSGLDEINLTKSIANCENAHSSFSVEDTNKPSTSSLKINVHTIAPDAKVEDSSVLNNNEAIGMHYRVPEGVSAEDISNLQNISRGLPTECEINVSTVGSNASIGGRIENSKATGVSITMSPSDKKTNS